MPRSKPVEDTEPPRPAGEPEVIVDFIFEQGLLHVSVANIGATAAHKIRVKFDQPFRGLGGTREISKLRLFRNLEFLPPGKQISSLIDTAPAFFERREPLKLAATISFLDRFGTRYERLVNHDLSVYTDISFVSPPAGAPPPPHFI